MSTYLLVEEDLFTYQVQKKVRSDTQKTRTNAVYETIRAMSLSIARDESHVKLPSYLIHVARVSKVSYIRVHILLYQVCTYYTYPPTT